MDHLWTAGSNWSIGWRAYHCHLWYAEFVLLLRCGSPSHVTFLGTSSTMGLWRKYLWTNLRSALEHPMVKLTSINLGAWGHFQDTVLNQMYRTSIDSDFFCFFFSFLTQTKEYLSLQREIKYNASPARSGEVSRHLGHSNDTKPRAT